MLSDTEKRARLAKALEYGGGTHSVEDVVDLIKAGRALLWEAGNGCVITELHAFPLQRSVHYWLISGCLEDCLALDAPISSWARENDCTLATACGRPGWGRVAASFGWKEWRNRNFYKSLSLESAAR